MASFRAMKELAQSTMAVVKLIMGTHSDVFLIMIAAFDCCKICRSHEYHSSPEKKRKSQLNRRAQPTLVF
jgi:hypothetical protein